MYVERVMSTHAVLSDVHCRMSHLRDHGFVECRQRKLASDVVKLYNAVPDRRQIWFLTIMSLSLLNEEKGHQRREGKQAALTMYSIGHSGRTN